MEIRRRKTPFSCVGYTCSRFSSKGFFFLFSLWKPFFFSPKDFFFQKKSPPLQRAKYVVYIETTKKKTLILESWRRIALQDKIILFLSFFWIYLSDKYHLITSTDQPESDLRDFIWYKILKKIWKIRKKSDCATYFRSEFCNSDRNYGFPIGNPQVRSTPFFFNF